MVNFKESCLSGSPVFLDGGMGTYIQQLGGDLFGARNNLEHPTLVTRVHDDYIKAGSRVITSNTFSLNQIYMDKKEFAPEKTRLSLSRAMELACESAGKVTPRVFVLGGFGPCGELFMGGKSKNYENEAVVEAYARQAETMSDWPIDAFLIETVFDLAEAELIATACKKISPEIPVVLSMTFATAKKGGATLMGNRPAGIAKWAEENGLFAVGANCGDLTPLAYVDVIKTYKEHTSLPLLIQPNAGMPVMDDSGEPVYPMDKDTFAKQMVECRQAGGTLLGGCCGTTPGHIQALVTAIHKL